MQAVILAGGLGMRLRGVVKDVPKSMADVGGEPFLKILLQDLEKAGVCDVVLAVGYLGEVIESYFGDGSSLGLSLHYAREKELLGTAGAIRNALPFLSEERVLVLNGDTYYRMDYGSVFDFAKETESDMAIVLRRVPDVSRYGKVTLDGNRVVRFNEKSGESEEGEDPQTNDPASGLINGGVYVMKTSLIEGIPEGKVSLENTCIPRWIGDGRRVFGLIHDGYFIDIGVPKDYARFTKDWKAQAFHS